MNLKCPNCETVYETPGELPPDGRKVRCASCQHVWLASDAAQPEQASLLADFGSEEIIFQAAGDKADEDQEAPAEPEAETETETETESLEEAASEAVADGQEPDTSDRAEPAEKTGKAGDDFSEGAMEKMFSAAVHETGQRRHDDAPPSAEAGDEAESPPIVIGKARRRGAISGGLAAGWAGLVLLLAGVAGVVYFQRVNIVRALPGAASAYARIGLPVNVRGLEFENVKYSWDESAGRPMLAVYGDIVNVTSRPLKVPTVVFGLRTKEKVEVYQWAADVRSELLPAGGRTAFTAQIPTPPKSIRDVQVRFVKVR